MPSYSIERHKWEMDIQTRYALDIYKRIWSGCEIVEVDKEAFKNVFAKDRDFGGLDKIIKIGRNEIHLSQRFRKPRKDKYTGKDLKVDFSFRYETPGPDGKPREAEYFYFMNAYKHKEEGFWLPSKYVFGVTKTEELDCGGFKDFYIFNIQPLLEAIDNGRIEALGIFKNYKKGIPDGSSAIYYRIEDLKEFIFFELPKCPTTLRRFF